MTENGGDTPKILTQLMRRVPDWAAEIGPDSGVILSSRIRFARNVSLIPFPAKTTPDQQSQVINRIKRAAEDTETLAAAVFIDVDTLEEPDVNVLVERRLVSKDLAGGERRRGVLVAPGEELTIMINEEDHLRLQSIVSGLRLGDALDRLSAVDDLLGKNLDFAFDQELGFLTACPTNVGTGMRASVLAHLPALVLTKRAKKVMQGVAAMGLAIRGFYGEGTEIMGNFFQISNQTTLGKGENEIVSRLDEVVRQILGYEEEARKTMWSRARVELEDKIYRAYGTLISARSISSDEVVSLASAVRFGITVELEDLCTLPVLNEILVYSQPGHVTHLAGQKLDKAKRREFRAQLVRKRLTQTDRETSSGNGGMSDKGSV